MFLKSIDENLLVFFCDYDKINHRKSDSMKDWLLKRRVHILMVFLVLQPIIDCLTALSMQLWEVDLTFGIFFRFGFLALLLLFNFWLEKPSKFEKTYLVLLLVYLILYTGNTWLTKDGSVLFYELKNMARLLYFPVLLLNLYFLRKRTILRIPEKILRFTYGIYLVLLFVPMITHTDFSGYFEGKVGSIGWFYSSNEIGAILSGLLPYFFFAEQKRSVFLLGFLVIVLVFFALGSKITIFTLLLVTFLFLLGQIRKSKNKKKILLGCIPLLLGGGLACYFYLPTTSFWKNIETHLDFLGIENIGEVFQKPEWIDHFIFSSRLSFLKTTHQNFVESDPASQLLGIGFIEKYGTDQVNLKTIEMDIFDIFYRSGWIGTILIILPGIFVIIDTKKEKQPLLFRKRQILSLGIFFLISCLAGHVLTSPAVSFYVVIIGLNWIKEDCYENRNDYRKLQ